MRTFFLHVRLWACVILLFAVIYGLLALVAYALGVGAPVFYAALAALIVAVQFFMGPRIVEWTMRVRYISELEYPELHRLVEDLARRAGIPKPRVGISEVPIPNAFAFGTSRRNARVCVTRRLLETLDRDELEAVLGHEISHIKHRDMLVITALSVIPMICYFVYYSLFLSAFFGGRSRDEGSLPTLAIAFIAFLVYFISNLIVLYASRIREYYADAGSVELTKRPYSLASALYKIIYGNARASDETLKAVQGLRAFFASDPATARRDLYDLREADINKDGRISAYELEAFARRARVPLTERLMELFSTHPHPVSRVKRLASYL
ncbi:MAG: Zn-dependent protease with chaperone function [Candidatus Alkanophagales archaeon MCA70_species_1]|nr:Zn-dependent protease with chaperone function [Candidatus Alkanophaga volatiphilum]